VSVVSSVQSSATGQAFQDVDTETHVADHTMFVLATATAVCPSTSAASTEVPR